MRIARMGIALLLTMVLAGCGSTTPSPAPTQGPSPTPAPPSSVGPVASAPPASIGPNVDIVATRDAVVHTSPHPPALDAVAFADREHGWAAGDGVILGTSDGGASWQIEWSGSRTILTLSVVDPRQAWALAAHASGASGFTDEQLLRTRDAVHWSVLPVAAPIGSVDFTSASSGWAVETAPGSFGHPGPLLETSDGGSSWHRTTLAAPVEGVCFAGPDLGWASSGSAIYRTTDAGTTWARVAGGPRIATGPGWNVAALHCAGDGAWVLFRGGGGLGQQEYEVERTLDRGAHWQTVLGNPGFSPAPTGAASIDAYSGPFAVSGASAAGFLGWCPACGYGAWSYTRTSDGGRTFAHAPLPGLDGATLADLDFADATHLWIAGWGAGGFLVASDDGGVSWQRLYPTAALGPALGISFVSPGVGFGLGTLGDGRAVLRSDDGGASWRTVGRLPADAARADFDPIVWFTDPQHGWVVTQAGLVATSDGGASWARMAGIPVPVPDSTPDGVAFADPLHGCTGNRMVARSTSDGGRSWQTADASHGVAACAAALLDPHWAQVATAFGPAHDLTLCAVLPVGTVVAQGFLSGGRLGTVISRDGGATWTADAWPSVPNGLGIEGVQPLSFVSADDGWALGLVGRLYRTTDGGATWEEIGPG